MNSHSSYCMQLTFKANTFHTNGKENSHKHHKKEFYMYKENIQTRKYVCSGHKLYAVQSYTTTTKKQIRLENRLQERSERWPILSLRLQKNRIRNRDTVQLFQWCSGNHPDKQTQWPERLGLGQLDSRLCPLGSRHRRREWFSIDCSSLSPAGNAALEFGMRVRVHFKMYENLKK